MTDGKTPDPQEKLPPVEDRAEPEETGLDDLTADEAEAAALSSEARAFEGGVAENAPAVPVDAAQASAAPAVSGDIHADDNGASDADRIIEEPASACLPSSRFRKGEWEQEFSAHKIAAELRRIENEVRQLLDDRDAKRKRKFGGTRRWHELEEDILGMRFNGRVDEGKLGLVLQLIARRHFLFRQLGFVAATRPTWNT